MTPSPSYLYSRQFVAGPRDVDVPNLSRRERFAETLTFFCHPALNVTRASADGRELLCLGHILNPRAPDQSDADILARALEGASSFDALETELARLGGRWLLFARFGDDLRMYPDAVGTKSSFYAKRGDELWIASQPNVLVDAIGVTIDQSTWSRFLAAPSGHSWPAAATPYCGVAQLQPNHYLDLRSGTSHRFWPTKDVPARSRDEAAKMMGDMLHGMMQALLARGTVAMAMTAGYDTRTLFASAGSLRERIRFFVVNDPGVAWHDIYLPRRLARRFGCSLDIIRSPRVDEVFWSTLQRNVAGLWWDPGDHRLKGFAKLPTRFTMLSLMSEVTRCHYYEDGVHPTEMTAESLASMSGYEGNPIAIDAFSKWLEDVPADTNVNGLDLFFMENRLGNWASMLATASDTVTEVIMPYNCRELLEIGLGADLEHRCPPFGLHLRICEMAAPETLHIPFNYMWQEDLCSRLVRLVPWRIREATFRTTMRLSGLAWARPTWRTNA